MIKHIAVVALLAFGLVALPGCESLPAMKGELAGVEQKVNAIKAERSTANSNIG